MGHLLFITNGFIFIGAVIMAFNTKEFYEVTKILKNLSHQQYDNLKLFFVIHAFLIISFLLGYLVVLFAVNTTEFAIGNLFAGIIFLFGAVFVFLGIILQKRMINALGTIYLESLSANKKLVQNQEELFQTNISLEKQIADRIKTEKKLIANQNHKIDIVNSLSSVIIGVDSNGRCTMWNDMARKLTSITSEDAIGKNVATLAPELSQIEDQIQEVITGSKVEFNKRFIQQKGRINKLFAVSICPLKNDDTQEAVVMLDDITQKVLMEKQIVQSEKMMSVGGLAAGMAHEINNPLTGMIQNAQVIYRRVTKDLPANDNVVKELGTTMSVIKGFMEKRGILKQLENINETGNRAAKIIDNMLSFARKSDSVRRKNKLNELIDKTIEIAHNDFDLKGEYDFKQIEICREYDQDVSEVLCEESKIQQVVLNLIKNASDAMNGNARGTQKPKLTFRIKNVDGMVCMEIHDNGPGMDHETQKRIFEPFFTTKGIGKGTGLGLSVSYFIIVDDHDGEIKVESILGEGSKFIIKLPKDQ